MSNPYFQFKQFTIHQDRCAMKVTTDACLFGSWIAEEIKNEKPARPADGLKIKNCLDVGTGTGLLSLMLAEKNPAINILAIEIDKDAMEQAKQNVDASPWKDQVEVIEGDVKNFSFSEKFDLIISNPPFYENELRSESQKKNLAHHSQDLTLGELLAAIKNNLSPNGAFFLLLPYKRNEEIKNLFRDHDLHISQIIFVKQSLNHDYFRIMLRGKLHNLVGDETEIDELSIWNDKQHYTNEFIGLLKDYYLYLS